MLQSRNISSLIPNRLRLAKEISSHFRDVSKYIPKDHRDRPNPLTQIHDAYNMKIDTTEYMNNRNYFSRLYRSMMMADIPHQDILSIYGNPYVGIVTNWGELSKARQQNILHDYPNTDRIAGYFNEAKQALTLELSMSDYDTKQFIQDFVIVGLSVLAEKRFKVPNQIMEPVYATRMERAFAYIQPKYEKIAYKISDKAGKLYKKAEDFFKKKGVESSKNRTKPTHDKQREFIEQKVNSGEWKRVRGRNMYENKKGQRFVPTKEKFEIEVGEKKDGMWQHIGIMRAEGNGVGEILKQYAKGKKGGHYFK